MDRKKKGKLLLSVLCVLTVLFIWGNSLLDKDESQAVSMELLRQIVGLAEKLGLIIEGTDDHWLRKLAHFCEFGLLGTELSLLMLLNRSFGRQGIVNCLFAGLLTAVADETIQLFSNRGSQVQDVLLDFSGVITAVVLVSAVHLAVRGRRARRGRGAEGSE